MGTAASVWVASAGLQVTSVKQSALAGAVRSGVGARDGGEDCGSCDGGCVLVDGGVLLGCDGDGRGAGTCEEGLAGAGVDESACDDACLAPVVTTSSPSCGPWSSCFRWQWH